jgi:hypothetical protein
MEIEGEMRTVDGEIPIEGDLQLPIKGSRHRLHSLPIKTVMNQKECSRYPGGLTDHPLAGIDSRHDPSDPATVLDLQAVHSPLIVIDLRASEKLVEMRNKG